MKLLSGNIMLQHKKKSKTGRITWATDGNYSDWASMAEYYIFNAPYRTIEGTAHFKKLLEIIKEAEAKIIKAKI